MKLTIHLLHDDQPTGPRTARIDQWSGKALCAPRTALGEVLKREELDGPCLYFLLAPAGGHTAPRVYVGEADGFRDRIRSHDATKDWWTALVAFFSADGSLTKVGIQFLEHLSLKLIREAGWCQLENATDPRPPTVPEEDLGGLEVFARNVKILMPVLGFDVFAEAPADAAGDSSASEEDVTPGPGADFDTIVCPAWKDGFESAFIGQRAWWAVRIGERNLPKIRYVAIYQVAPISAITHYGEVDHIEKFRGHDEYEGKYKLFLKAEPIRLSQPVVLGPNVLLRPMSPRYARLRDILSAKTLADVFGRT